MKSLQSQGQVIQRLQHKALPGSLLHLGYVPAKMGTDSVKQFPVSVTRKPYPKITGFLFHQECQRVNVCLERSKCHNKHSALSHLHKSGQTKILLPTGSTGSSWETLFLISAHRQKGVTWIIYTDE